MSKLFSSLAFAAVTSMSYASLAQTKDAGPDNVEAVTRARSHFERGAELYKEGSFDAALAEFSRAYETVPNYRVLYNIGQVQVERHDYVAALKAFQDYLRQGQSDISAERREQMERDIAQMKTRVSELQVTSNVGGAELFVDGASIGTTPLASPVLVSAGTRRLRLAKPGYVTVERTISVTGGDRPEVSLRLQPLALENGAPSGEGAATAKAEGSPLGAGAWVSLIATGAFASGAVAFGLLANAKDNDLDAELDRFPVNRARVDDTRSQLKLYAALSDGSSVAAGVSAAIAIYFIVSRPSGAEAAQMRKATRLVPLHNGLAVAGQF